jgi:GMP synthase-like glutamine amidotransferase
LAQTPHCPISALKFPGQHIYGVQFHPEVSREQGMSYYEKNHIEIDPGTLPKWSGFNPVGITIFRNFLNFAQK